VLCLLASFLSTSAQDVVNREHVPRMSYIDNGTIRLGVDLNLGGAITYLSPAGTNKELNLINSHDWGRQVQLSYYSGPVPFQPPGARMAENWKFLGWNPIQSGDCYGHDAKVLQHTNSGHSLYIKCIPMQWPLDNVPGDCECEVWLELRGPAVKARCRLRNHRADHTQYAARGQELPAVYVNGPFYRLMTYTGDKPFTGDALTRIEKRPGEGGIWSSWIATENWAAQVNDDGWGLGVFSPVARQFIGGFAGKPGKGGPLDNPTGYIAPTRSEILDYNIVYDYEYELIVGTLEEIRSYVYKQASRPSPPEFQFTHDRQGWTYHQATDAGWPIRDALQIRLDKEDPQLVSPVFFVPAADAPKLTVEAAFQEGITNLTIFWRKHGQNGFSETQSLNSQVGPDGKLRTYEIKLSNSPAYNGKIIQLRIDPNPSAEDRRKMKLKSVRLGE